MVAALAERTQREQGFMERYVATLDDNQQQLAEQYIADAATYNALTDKWVLVAIFPLSRVCSGTTALS